MGQDEDTDGAGQDEDSESEWVPTVLLAVFLALLLAILLYRHFG